MLEEKIKSSNDTQIDKKFFPVQMLYPSSKKSPYMLNLGKHFKYNYNILIRLPNEISLSY